MRTNITFILLIFWAITACQKKQPPLQSLNGNWESIASGWILTIKDSTHYSFYDTTPISCILNRQGAFQEIEKSLRIQNDTLYLQNGVITYKFLKTDTLPDLCSTTVTAEKKADPIYNFEVFAETVKEHYAFMELNSINWKDLYTTQKEKLGSNATNVELYQVIEETLEKLNDNHAYLEADDTTSALIDQLNTEEESEQEDLPKYGDFQIAEIVAKHHLEEEMTKDSWLIQWGKFNDTTGYIQIKAMWLYAALDIPKSLIKQKGYVDAYVETFNKMYEGAYIEKEVIGVANSMDQVMNDLSDMESLIIDVRFNGGGQDAVSFEILSRFIPQKLQVATQKLKYGVQFSPTIPLYIPATDNAYTRPVYILTSQQTGSAAEAFSIASMAMKNVKRIGSPTSGAMSTELPKTLPNGWHFSISNEIYMDNAGNCYENKGIPVHYELKYPEERQAFFRSIANDLKNDKTRISQAIKALQKP
ncbi:S41 family peptidase [Aquimarina sp. TRL1]|uniref:S41 family peptidase n=1 Tax=Aquimarina sp. (strain TRL1) TaxID=2736252 RepID=UPI00158B51AE|nr:S41 family peptidase [Aquimarina sp. TRL1]QKX06031.1 S41 family peptidase [Aquimarina sp. TRL1]